MSLAATGGPLAAPGAERHWNSLDALRGIAALLVVTFHCSQVSSGFAARGNPFSLAGWTDPWAWLKYTPLRLLVSSGPPAVVLFFALSGFVLSLPFLRSRRQPGYAEFAVKRVCRIYPPFAFAILVSAALYAVVQPVPVPGLSAWFNEVLWTRPLSADYVFRNLMMTGLRDDMTLDLVMWSLVHELRISLVFPILFVLTRRWPAATFAASLLAGVACTAILAGTDADSLAMSLVDTGRFVVLFVAGILIAGNLDAVRGAVARLPSRAAPAFWLAGVGLLMAPGPSVFAYYNFVWGLGAVLLLMLVVGSPAADRMLSARPLVWLGKVSYSLYLIHVPLLIAAIHVTYGRLPLWITIAAVIPASLACAELMHRFVERPSIRLGRVLCGMRRHGAASPAALPLTTARAAGRTRQ
jgi:peptidoglycan/LPS O-acetylase OafA/YrhL